MDRFPRCLPRLLRYEPLPEDVLPYNLLSVFPILHKLCSPLLASFRQITAHVLCLNTSLQRYIHPEPVPEVKSYRLVLHLLLSRQVFRHPGHMSVYIHLNHSKLLIPDSHLLLLCLLEAALLSGKLPHHNLLPVQSLLLLSFRRRS